MQLYCPAPVDDPFFCPTQIDIWRQIMALLPPGRAWQNHEESIADRVELGSSSQVGPYELGDSPLGTESVVELKTVMERYWYAHAGVLEYLHQRACALIDEMFCESVAELAEAWRIEFGFPDPCDPWDTLCEKVRAMGGATCAYLAGIAADRGWALTCSECEPSPGARTGCFTTGCAKTCGCPGNTIWVTVALDDSPAYTERRDFRTARAGAARAGFNYTGQACPPGAEPLQCLIERFKPAHVRAVYIYV